MITTITGGPGTGKTAFLIDQLLNLRKIDPNREFYIHGIRNLRGLPHKQIFCKSQLCDICRSQTLPADALYVENWHEWKPSGALIVVDEVQRIWRPRTGGSKIPESVSGLETHRHYGLDFWLISQGPHLFDANIRLLVGRHIHLVSRWSGRTQYEWPECQQNVQSRTDAVIRPYTLPKRVYSMYDSAEVHTKQDKRKPLALYIVIACLALLVIMAVVMVNRFSDRITPTTDTTNEIKPGAGQSIVSADKPKADQKKRAYATPEELEKALTPLVPGVPWSAPYYAELARPVSFPKIVGCIKSKVDFRCACYTQQNTLVDVPPDVCSIYVDRRPFDHFKPDKQRQQQQQQQLQAATDAPPIEQQPINTVNFLHPDEDE